QAAHALAHSDPAVWRSELEGIAAAEQRASRTVDQLLALARATEGGIALALQPLALNTAVREVVLRYLPRADALGVDLGAEGLDHAVAVQANLALVEGILNNLLDNALRYGRGQPPRITVSLHTEAAHAVLCVADNGPGVGLDLAGQLQQRWAQGGPGLQLGQGAGLGLSIVARYAQLMGGRLELGDADAGAHGAGLAARVWLPLVARGAGSTDSTGDRSSESDRTDRTDRTDGSTHA
ncbi:MAG: HAMP domain-containing histidine kinase, partial [Acidovorax sp.]